MSDSSSDVPKLGRRQIETLEEIKGWKTGYSKYWTKKTSESLQDLGLVEIGNRYVNITAKGKIALKAKDLEQ